MSLFENDQYRWRETYFVLFHESKRPKSADVQRALKKLDPRYVLIDIREIEGEVFESLTLLSPDDYAAMDISYVSGEEVTEQIEELRAEMKGSALTADEKAKLRRLLECNARFDIYHFEQVVEADEQEEFLDPGALLNVLERLARLVDGVAIDPQSGTLM
jgi:hypothetical protein